MPRPKSVVCRSARTRRDGERTSVAEPITTVRLDVMPSFSVTRLELAVYREGEHEHGPHCQPVSCNPGFLACLVLTPPDRDDSERTRMVRLAQGLDELDWSD